MQEELDDKFVHLGALGKRKGLAHEPPQPLAQGVIEAFDAVGRTTFRIISRVLSERESVVIILQVAGVEKPVVVPFGDASPKRTGGYAGRGPAIARSHPVGGGQRSLFHPVSGHRPVELPPK